MNIENATEKKMLTVKIVDNELTILMLDGQEIPELQSISIKQAWNLKEYHSSKAGYAVCEIQLMVKLDI